MLLYQQFHRKVYTYQRELERTKMKYICNKYEYNHICMCRYRILLCRYSVLINNSILLICFTEQTGSLSVLIKNLYLLR